MAPSNLLEPQLAKLIGEFGFDNVTHAFRCIAIDENVPPAGVIHENWEIFWKFAVKALEESNYIKPDPEKRCGYSTIRPRIDTYGLSDEHHFREAKRLMERMTYTDRTLTGKICKNDQKANYTKDDFTLEDHEKIIEKIKDFYKFRDEIIAKYEKNPPSPETKLYRMESVFAWIISDIKRLEEK